MPLTIPATAAPDGGVAEIVQYNEDNGKLYLVNGLTRTVDIVTLGEYGEDELETTFDANTDRIDLSGMPAAHPESFEDGFEVGDITSVAVNTELDVIACAVQHTDYEKNRRDSHTRATTALSGRHTPRAFSQTW